jgi:hypothetical protein
MRLEVLLISPLPLALSPASHRTLHEPHHHQHNSQQLSYAQAAVEGARKAAAATLNSQLNPAAELAANHDSKIAWLPTKALDGDCAYALALIRQFAIDTALELANGNLTAQQVSYLTGHYARALPYSCLPSQKSTG